MKAPEATGFEQVGINPYRARYSSIVLYKKFG